MKELTRRRAQFITEWIASAGFYGFAHSWPREEQPTMTNAMPPGWEGSIGPFPSQYREPHVYARDVHSGAGNCVCGAALGQSVHIAAAPGVPIPGRLPT